MGPSFIVFLNKTGIACAADAERTIFPLSDNGFIAAAVSTSSNLPWEKIMLSVQVALDGRGEISFDDCQQRILQCSQDCCAEKMEPDNNRVVLFGYGISDLYPSAVSLDIILDADGTISCNKRKRVTISNSRTFDYLTIGDFDCVDPILKGSSINTRKKALELFSKGFDEFKTKILDSFAGTVDEAAIKERLSSLSCEPCYEFYKRRSEEKLFGDLKIGISAFEKEEMADAVESLVNINSRLLSIKSQNGNPRQVAELALICRPEGFSKLK